MPDQKTAPTARYSPLDDLLTPEDHVHYIFNPKAVWEWQANEGACDACRALHGKRYRYPDIPLRPHPNCKCKARLVEGDSAHGKKKRILAIGWLEGFEGHAWEHFDAGKNIAIEFKNVGAHLAGVNVLFSERMEHAPKKGKTTGILFQSKPVKLTFTATKDGIITWDIFLTISGGDNTIIQYTITD